MSKFKKMLKFLFVSSIMIITSACEKQMTLVENVEFGGVLGTMYERINNSLFEKGNQYYIDAYKKNDDLWNAEPEFAGKYMLICSILGGKYLDQAKDVVNACKLAQREDGYLGCLPEGNELINFSIWNQTFTILGLVEYYNATKNLESLNIAKKSADYIEEKLKDEISKGKRITDSLNGGSQHISCIISFVRLYKATREIKYLDFAQEIILQCENENFKLLTFNDIFDIKSQKGIEMLVVYLGISELANVLQEENIEGIYSSNELLDAVSRYWDEINSTQIRNTGSATTGEWFVRNGNAPSQLKTSQAVNENCVSVGWCELTSSLFWTNPQAIYLDALEKTLFNAVLGSASTDGSDFAYYQGNYGRKEFVTSGGMYKCCRMRGINLFACLPSMLYKYDNNNLIPVIYSQGNFKNDNLEVNCLTNYPQDGLIKYYIKTNNNKQNICLRVPAWCNNYQLKINNEKKDISPLDGFINCSLKQGETIIELNFEMEFSYKENKIQGEKYYDFNYGPLLLCHDRSNNTSLKECYFNVNDEIRYIKNDWNYWNENNKGSYYMVQFTSGNLNLVDYASSCRNNPERDMFKVYIKGYIEDEE